MTRDIHSSHHFILPFVIKNKARTKLNVSQNWKRISRVEDLPHMVEDSIFYAYQRYFNDESLEVIVENHQLVENYYYQNPKGYRLYRISYYNRDNQLDYFDLDLSYILLRYHPGLDASFLIIATRNTGYDKLSDFQLINQYGRRIYTPFLGSTYAQLEAPNDLELLVDAVKPPQHSGKLDRYQIMSAPLQLLEDFFGFSSDRIFPEKNLSDQEAWLDIIVDDRMFVHASFKSDDLALLIQATQEQGELNKVQLQKLYEIAFVDNPGNVSCQSIDMLRDIMTKTIYSRWAEYKSLYLSTQHSFIYLAGAKNTPSYLIDYFNSEYLDMVLLTLAQRVGLLKYSQQAGNSVNNHTKDLLVLKRNFVTFKNQFLLPEISAQEQAHDLYTILQDNLRVVSYSDILNDQISSLTEIAQVESESELNSYVFWLTIATVVVTMPLFENKLSSLLNSRIFQSWTILDIVVVIIIVILVLFWKLKRK